MNKITKFWEDHKDTIKNITIAVAVPLAVIALMGIRNLNKTIEENDLNELFYGDPEEESQEDLNENVESLLRDLNTVEEA